MAGHRGSRKPPSDPSPKSRIKSEIARAVAIRRHGEHHSIMIEIEERTSTHQIPNDVGEEIVWACIDVITTILTQRGLGNRARRLDA